MRQRRWYGSRINSEWATVKRTSTWIANSVQSIRMGVPFIFVLLLPIMLGSRLGTMRSEYEHNAVEYIIHGPGSIVMWPRFVFTCLGLGTPIWWLTWNREPRMTKLAVVIAIGAGSMYYTHRWAEDLRLRPEYCEPFNCWKCAIPAATVTADTHRKCCFCCDIKCTPQWAYWMQCRRDKHHGNMRKIGHQHDQCSEKHKKN